MEAMDLFAEYQRATLFFDSGDPAEAARLLEPVLAAEPDNSAVRQLLARAYFYSAQLDRAEEHLRALVHRHPSDHYAHHVLGRTLERRGRTAEALPHLRLAAAMRADGEYVEAARRVERKVADQRGPGRGRTGR